MAEQVIDYGGNKNSNWLQNKMRGLSNRYHIYKRTISWAIHAAKTKIEPDFSKIPDGAIPILINNYNRLDLLKQQIEWLLSLEGNNAIIIVDNDSSYPPLLDYYESLNYSNVQVVYLHFNSWRKGVEHLHKKLHQSPYIVITDSDLLPYQNTPKDLMLHLVRLMEKYPKHNHIGTSLEIEDIPDDSPMKTKVQKYEKRFWAPEAKLLNNEVYEAKIDTTFAMYRNNSVVLITEPALRTDRPYTLKHIDWYLNPKDFSDEYKYYLASCKSFATWATELKKNYKVAKERVS